MQGVENTHCLHSLQLSPFLAFDCLFQESIAGATMVPTYALTSVFDKSGLANKKGADTAMSTSFVTTVGAGVPSVYGSKAKTYCVSETCPCFQRRSEPSRHQLAKIISVEHGHVGLTVDPIILKDLCRLVQSLLLDHHQPTSIFPSQMFEKKRIGNFFQNCFFLP
jgi:hypothetical protein